MRISEILNDDQVKVDLKVNSKSEVSSVCRSCWAAISLAVGAIAPLVDICSVIVLMAAEAPPSSGVVAVATYIATC